MGKQTLGPSRSGDPRRSPELRRLRRYRKYRETWDRVIEAWGNEMDRREAWRNADASLIPEFVPPKSIKRR